MPSGSHGLATNDAVTVWGPAETGARTSRLASAACMYNSHEVSPTISPFQVSGPGVPVAPPPTVNRLMRVPSSRRSRSCA